MRGGGRGATAGGRRAPRRSLSPSLSEAGTDPSLFPSHPFLSRSWERHILSEDFLLALSSFHPPPSPVSFLSGGSRRRLLGGRRLEQQEPGHRERGGAEATARPTGGTVGSGRGCRARPAIHRLSADRDCRYETSAS